MVTHPKTREVRTSVPDAAVPDAAVPDAAVPDPAVPDAREQFRTLPDPVRVEDTIASHPRDPAPDIALGDPDTDWLLRNAG